MENNTPKPNESRPPIIVTADCLFVVMKDGSVITNADNNMFEGLTGGAKTQEDIDALPEREFLALAFQEMILGRCIRTRCEKIMKAMREKNNNSEQL